MRPARLASACAVVSFVKICVSSAPPVATTAKISAGRFRALIAELQRVAGVHLELRGGLHADFACLRIRSQIGARIPCGARDEFRSMPCPLRAGNHRRLEMDRARFGHFADHIEKSHRGNRLAFVFRRQLRQQRFIQRGAAGISVVR